MQTKILLEDVKKTWYSRDLGQMEENYYENLADGLDNIDGIRFVEMVT